MLYRNESRKRKHVPGQKAFFREGEAGFFSNFRGELTKKWGEGVDQHSFLEGDSPM